MFGGDPGAVVIQVLPCPPLIAIGKDPGHGGERVEVLILATTTTTWHQLRDGGAPAQPIGE